MRCITEVVVMRFVFAAGTILPFRGRALVRRAQIGGAARFRADAAKRHQAAQTVLAAERATGGIFRFPLEMLELFSAIQAVVFEDRHSALSRPRWTTVTTHQARQTRVLYLQAVSNLPKAHRKDKYLNLLE